ncbi:MAG TPA: hypothetical protein PKM58_05020, partial [Pyrinomonadaceae bacterium]|nr:hypothetical protein [Pyrinomonadaceae bacterium]
GAQSSGKEVIPFLNQNGKTFVNLQSSLDTAENASGILAYVEVEALVDGRHDFSFDPEIMTMLTNDGVSIGLKF